MIQIISDYWAWFVGFAGLATALSWLPGFGVGVTILTSGLRIISSVFEMISPIINSVFTGLIYLWKEILYPGFLDIFDNIRTALTFVIIILFIFVFFDVKYKLKVSTLDKKITSVERAYTNNRPVAPIQPEEFDLTRLLPWNW